MADTVAPLKAQNLDVI